MQLTLIFTQNVRLESQLKRYKSQAEEGEREISDLKLTMRTLKKEARDKDVAGIGLSWGAPSDGSLRDQFTSEVFYRFQLTQFLAVTPDIQFIIDPAVGRRLSW